MRPRDLEDVEAPDNLEVVTFSCGHPVLPGADVEEVAAARGDLYADIDASSLFVLNHFRLVREVVRSRVGRALRPPRGCQRRRCPG